MAIARLNELHWWLIAMIAVVFIAYAVRTKLDNDNFGESETLTPETQAEAPAILGDELPPVPKEE